MGSGASSGKTKSGRSVKANRETTMRIGEVKSGLGWATGRGALKRGAVSERELAAAQIRAGITGRSSTSGSNVGK